MSCRTKVDKETAAMFHALVLLSKFHIRNQEKKSSLIDRFIAEYDSSLTIKSIVTTDPIQLLSTLSAAERKQRFARYVLDMVDMDVHEPPCTQHLSFASRLLALLLDNKPKK